MNTISKPNDWFLARVENPDFHYDDFAALDITIDNTALRSKDVYLNSEYVKELFSDEEGNFKQAEFDRAYTEIAKSYQIYANKQYEEGALEDMEFDPYDPFRPVDSKVYTPEAKLVREVNPLGKASGFTGIGSVGPAIRSASESAQMSKIFDWETQQFRDYSPNDVALENSVLGFIKQTTEPLVMALYESEGFHTDPFTGEQVHHQKGEYKVNDLGMYYYETLGGRSAYGKQFKSIADSFTVDGSTLNDYDFFDSDGLDKSVVGTLMKTAVTIAPLFTPIAPYYGWAMIGTELLDLLPTVYEATVGNFTEDTNPTLNYIQGLGKSLKGSTTEYAKEHILALENLGTIISDVALQWQLFRIIPQAYNKLVGTDKAQKAIFEEAEQMAKKSVQKRTMENALKQGVTDEKALAGIAEKVYQQELSNALGVLNKTKLEPLLKANNRTGANVALGYMSALQSVQTYEDAINLGTSKTEAAALAWGTALGVYAVGRTGLGELFFPELQDVNKKAYTVAINKMRDSIQSGINNLASMPKKTKLLKLMDVGKKASSKFWQDVKDHSLGFVGKSIGEGIEEMAEEGISDFFKATHNLAAEFGVASTDKQFSFDNMGEKYLMSFVGGSIGGAVFGAVDLVNHIKSPESVKQELTYLLRNGRKEELLLELETLHKKGKLGSKILSTDYTEDPTDPKVKYFQTAESEDKSHNTFIYNKMKNYIESIDAAINLEKINYSDEDVLDKLARADERLAQVQEVIGKDGINGRYLQRFNTLTSEIITQKAKIAQLENETPDEKKLGEEKSNFQKTLAAEYAKLEDLKKELDDYFSDANVVDYANKLLFEIDSNVNSAFYNANIQQYIEGRSGKSIDELSVLLLEKYKEDYEAFKKMSIREKFDDAYTIFKNLNHKLTGDINSKNDIYTQYGKMRQYVLDTIIDPEKTALKFGEHESIESVLLYALNGQVDLLEVANDEFVPRYYAIPEEATPEQIELINQYNAQVDENILNVHNRIREVVARLKEIGFIDTATKKLLLSVAPRLSALALFNDDTLLETINGETVATSVAKLILNLLLHKALSINFVDSTLSFDPDGEFAFNLETVGEAFKEILLLLADDSKFKNFDVDYDELTVQIAQILHKHLNDQGESNFLGLETHPNRVSVVTLNGTYIRNEAEEDVFDVSKTWYGTKVAELIQGIKQVIERSTQYQLFQELKSELGLVQNSPLYDFLLKLSVSINGAHSSVIDLLLKQELDLENGDINDFLIDSVVASEIDSALNLVDIAKSLVNAADTLEFSAFNVYGHNAVINDFSTKMGLPTEYGIISLENAYVIRQDLQAIVDKLNLIKQISALNEANSFKELERTGKNTTKILTQVLKCNGKYTALKDIEVLGVSLFGGVESISTEHTDQNTKDLSDEVYVEHAKVVMAVYNNYLKILQQAYANGLSEKEVAAELITKLRSAFLSMALLNQETSELNSFIDSMTDSDVMTYIITSCSIDPVTWNEQLKALIGSKATKFVPLYPQELTALIGSALVKNGTLFLEYITSIVENYEGKDSVPNALYNWLMCSGVGGAGKTSVVGKIIYEVCKSIDPEIKTWNVGPTVTQIENLNKTLPANESMDINSLMSKILDPGEHELLVKAMSDKNMDSRYSSKSEEGHLNVKLPEDIKFSDALGPAIIFLDECTYVNSIYAKIISEWARQKGVTVIGLGDSKQSGFYDEKMNLFNVSRASAISMRTPELNISMRASNILKKANNNKLSTIMSVVNAMAYGDADKQSAYEKLLGDFSLRYFIDENKLVKGDYVTDSIIKEKIQAMINGCKSLIYIYDNPNSPTYSIISLLKTENPEVSIELHTVDEVQGKEAELVIVDLDFNKYSTNNFSNMRTINTALTRALEGTTIIDNGFSKLFPEFKNTKDTYTTNTPDPEKIVESYKESKLNIIDRILSEVSPAKKAELPEPNTALSSEEEEEKPEKSLKKVSKRYKAIKKGKEVIQPAEEPENEPPKEETSEESSEEPNEEESLDGNTEGQNASEKEKLLKKLEKVRSFVKDIFSIDEELEAFGSNGMIPKPMIETLVSTFEKALLDDSLETSGITEQELKDLIDDLNNGVIDDWILLASLIVNIMYDNSKRPMSDKARLILINELENDDNLPDDEKLYPDFDSYVKGILIEELKNGNINTLEEFDAALSSDLLISSEDLKRMLETINNLRDEYAANGDTMQDNEKYILRKIIQKYENHGYLSSTELESDIEKLRVLREPEDVPHILTDEDIDLIAEISDSVSEDGGSAPSIEPSYNFAKGVRTLGSYKETGINVENGIVKYTEIPGVKSDLLIWLTNNFDITTEKGEDRYNKITSLHNVAKKMLLHYPDQPLVALLCMLAELGLEYEDTYKLAFLNGTYKVISLIDPRNNSRKMAKLVYSYSVNGNENIITLSELSNPDTWLSYLTDTLGLDKANPDEVSAARTYKQQYEELLSRVTKTNPIHVVELDKGSVVSALFNVISSCNRYSIVNVLAHNQDNICSRPFLYSGKGDELTKCNDPVKLKILKEKAIKLQGKAVMFMTSCPYVQDLDSPELEFVKVTPENIQLLYLQQRRHGVHHIIRRMIVDPATLFATNRWEKGPNKTTKIRGYLNFNLDEMSENDSKDNKDVLMHGSEVVGVRMYVGLWNYRASLMQFKKHISKDKFKNADGSINVKAVNADIADSDSNVLRSFRLARLDSEYRVHPDSTNENYLAHFDSYPGTNKDNNAPFNAGLHITLKELDILILYIDGIIKFINSTVLNPTGSSVSLKGKRILSKSPTTIIKYSGKVYKDLFSEFLKDITIAGIDVKINDNDIAEDEEVSGILSGFGQIDKSKSKAIVMIMSRLYKIMALQGQRDDAIYFGLGNLTIGDEKIELPFHKDLQPILSTNATERLYKGKYRASLFLDIINTAFHGRPRPYTQKEPAILSPFPKGIFYNLMYNGSSKDTTLAEFHEIRNPDSHMELNAVVLAPHVYINLSRTKTSAKNSSEPIAVPATDIEEDENIDEGNNQTSFLSLEVERLLNLGIDPTLFDDIDEDWSKEEILANIVETIELNEQDTAAEPDGISNVSIYELSKDEDEHTIIKNRTSITDHIQKTLYKDGNAKVMSVHSEGGQHYVTSMSATGFVVNTIDEISLTGVRCGINNESPKTISGGAVVEIINAFSLIKDPLPEHPFIKTIKEYLETAPETIVADDILDMMADNSDGDVDLRASLAESINWGLINADMYGELVFKTLMWLKNNDECI